MSVQPGSILDTLRGHAGEVASRSYVPYSGRDTAVVLLLSDGSWVPGVRVENASFSLVIPALLNAYTTAVAAGRRDVSAVAFSRPAEPEELAFLQGLSSDVPDQIAPDAVVLFGVPLPQTVGDRLDPFLNVSVPRTAAEGIRMVRKVAQNAFVPESGFPVGCILITGSGRLVPGVNVEHRDWTHVLCAERNALGTAVTYGAGEIRTIYLTCLQDPFASPCGACRQVLVEHAPEATLWMDRGAAEPVASTPAALLPGAFSGRTLVRSTSS